MTLNDTIRALRRERGMTQEQLAEAMNVSAAAVSKWENGQSVPDILVLTALADFFEVSLDALVGYTVQAHRRSDLVARISQLVVQKKHAEATRAAREALRRYPNSFDVVYEATRAYGYSGMEQNRPEDLRKALSLAERAMVLIQQDQERDSRVHPESIWSMMGSYHAHLNEYDEAIRCYENGNVAEVNDIAIANAQTEIGCYDHALPKLSRGLVVSLTRLFNAATGAMNCLIASGRQQDAIALSSWLCRALDGMESSAGSYIWKMKTLLYTGSARAMVRLNRMNDAELQLRQAIHCARRFDAAPSYSVSGFRFYWGEDKPILDIAGETAMNAITRYIDRHEDTQRELKQLFLRLQQGA